jgi:hypothetical protein
MGVENIKLVQWWQLADPCSFEVAGLQIRVCNKFGGMSCEKYHCSKKIVHQAVRCLLNQDMENYAEYLNLAVEDLGEKEGDDYFNILDQEAAEKSYQIKDCSKSFSKDDEIFFPVGRNKEARLADEINEIGNSLVSVDIKDENTRNFLLIKMKNTVRQAMDTGLSDLDGIAKLAVIFGLEDRVKQFKHIPLFRDEIKLRHPVLEEKKN